MAATIQTPAQQPPPTTNNTSPANPQLKRIVYSKYRELLGSYNDKANAIIESLPAYMVKEDRGFHFDPKIIDEVDKVVYGTPPAPPPLSTGSVPTQRLSSQIPQYNVGEAPACVQNAMMTKDKKPFTYTPGGIDLSQIKSQRMAKRLARNAQSEGATGQQQMNRPTPPPQQQQQSNGGTPPAAAAQLGATAMGMPFQVFPTGPPPPPPQPSKVGPPPPPPPAPQNKLAPQSNGNAAHARKSPTPQNFEPPPMGFRPEIKIPPNPMAALKKVAPPQEKNNFWVEEYRKERSKSPMVGNDENDYNRSPPNNPQPETNQYTYNNYNNSNEYQPQQNQYRSPSPQPMRQQQEYYNQRAPSPPRTPAHPLDQQRRIESPYQTQYSPQPQQQSPSIQRQSSQYQPPSSPPQQQQLPPIQRQQTAPPPQQYQGPTSPQYQQQQQEQISPTQQQQQQSVPWRSQRQMAPGIQNNVSRPRDVMSPAPSESSMPQPQQQQQQQQYPAYLRSREVLSPAPELQPPQMSQQYQQKNSQVGSIYIPPVATQQQQQQSPPYQDPQGVRQQQTSRQVPVNRWMPSQPQPGESQTLNRIKSPPPPSSNGFGSGNNTGLRLQINNNTSNSNAKERIIPIQLEHTPTPTRTPSAPGFGPQPFYNANQQQYSSVPSPPLAQGATSNGQNSPNYIVRSPNQFVDQGYNNYPGSQDPNRVTSPTSQQMQSARIVQQTNTVGGVKTRIIPIALESQPDGPLNPNNVRGPISQQPLVIQNDPRNQNTWGSGSTTPVQSKSFRILQKITDTTDDGTLESKAIESDGGEQEPQLQRPTYARQMGPGQVNSPTIEQMKRMQLNNEQAFANRARNQDEDEKPTVKAANEDPRYRGPSNPSKTFKKLQGAVERCSPSGTDQDGTSPVMKQPQPNRYINQRPVYSPEDSQQYVHPSEQQVPEPKIYTGSAIPSRSFKILQAMTTPENAAEMEGSDVVETNKSITECPYQQPPLPYAYPYPYMPACCPPPPPPPPPPHSSSGGDVHNWQYPSPHYHPHQHHPYPPCPYYYYYPPNEYDSQNCNHYHGRDSFSRSKSQSQDLPNIIITPSAEDIPHVVRGIDLGREQREGSVIDTLSRRLSEIAKPVNLDLNMSQEDDKEYVGDGGKEFNNSPSPVKSECENNNVSSEDSSEDLFTSSTDPSTTSSFEDCAEQLPNDGLQAIKSVTNIQVYNNNSLGPMDCYEDDRTVDDGESMIFDDDEEGEEIVGEELEYDEEELLIEEMDSEGEGEIEELDEDEVIVMDDLSVIYEENEADIVSPRPSSRISSSVSDSSTLANEECLEEEEADKMIKEDDEDENSNSVTVRLPLKFSFSRSSNDESIATIEVGKSQIEDKRKSFNIASVEAEPEEDDSDSQDCDVSVTISLSPSSGSFDRKASVSPVPRSIEAVVAEEVKQEVLYDSEAEDVSVSFSMPMQSTNSTVKKKKKSDVEAWRRNISVFEDKKDTTKSCDTEKNGFVNTSNASTTVVNREEITAAETMRRDCTVLEAKEEATVVLEKEVGYVCNSNDTESNGFVNTYVKKEENTAAETSRRSSSVFEDNEEKTVALKWNSITDVLVNTEIKKIKVVENSEGLSSSNATREDMEQTKEDNGEELDFWATLQATRREAQLFLEKTADYWGKKIDGKEKDQAKPENVPNEAEKPKESQTEEDFWATIRVKDTAEQTKPVKEPVDIQPPKESKTKSTKPKKKKKIIKAAPEKEPEPEHVWSTIKLPNANNRAKIVESTIKMIQDKAKKPLVKSLSKEVEVGDFVASIKVTYDKEHEEEVEAVSEDSVCIKPTSDKKPTEAAFIKDISTSITVTKQKEDSRSNLIKEKAELKTQILNQKFAKAFMIPDKPPVMKGVSSEVVIDSVKTLKKWEFSAQVSTPIAYESESPNVAIVIEKSEKVDKPKKKKKVQEDSEVDTLKLPKAKSVKKSTKESKKVKKKKQETVEDPEDIKENVEEKVQEIEKESEEPDFWAEIESSKSSLSSVRSAEMTNKFERETQEVDFWVETKPSVDHQETDFWAAIEASKVKREEDEVSKVNYSSVDGQEPDFWTEIDYSKAKKEEEVESLKVWNSRKSSAEVQADFWEEIESSQADIDHKTSIPKSKKKSRKIQGETPSIDRQESTFEAPNEDRFEVNAQEIDIWADVEPSKVDFWAEIESSKSMEKTEEVDIWSQAESVQANSSVEPQDIDIWSEIDSTEAKWQEKRKIQTDFWNEIESSKAEAEEPKPKKKSNETLQEPMDLQSTDRTQIEPLDVKEEVRTEEIDIWSDIESDSPRFERHEIKVEETNIWSQVKTYKVSHQETDFWLDIDISKPIWHENPTDFWKETIVEPPPSETELKPSKPKSKKKSKEESVTDADFIVEAESYQSKTKKKSSRHSEELPEIDLETGVESSKLKSKKKSSTLSEVPVSNDFEVEAECPKLTELSESVFEIEAECPKLTELVESVFEIEAESAKIKTKKKSSKHREESNEIDVEAGAEVAKPKSKKKSSTLSKVWVSNDFEVEAECPKLTELSESVFEIEAECPKLTELAESVFEIEAESPKVKTKKKSSKHREESNEIDVEAGAEVPKPKSKNKSSTLSKVSISNDFEVEAECPKLTELSESVFEIEAECPKLTELAESVFEIEAESPKVKTKKKSSKHREESNEIDVEAGAEVAKLKSKKKRSKHREESADIDLETGVESPKLKTKKKSSRHRDESSEIDLETGAESPKLKTKKKSSRHRNESTEIGPEIQAETSKFKTKKKTLSSDETDFWAEIETSKPKSSKKALKSSSLHVYTDYDVELINLKPVPTYYAVHMEPEIEVDFWASISYSDEDAFPKSKPFEEREADFWGSNSSGNETEVNSEVDTGKIDFWVTQRKFENISAFARETTPKREQEPEEVDFWAEIKGSTDVDDEIPAAVFKDECEVRRNNYKKAMAFFTNTVNVEKKDESPAPPRNIDPLSIYEEEKTPETQSYNTWSWKESAEHDWVAPEEQEVNDVFLIVEDNETEDEPDTVIENNPYEMEEGCEFEAIEEEQGEEEEEETSESISDSTPNHFQIEHQYPKPEPEPIIPKEQSIEPISNKFSEEIKISVKDRIFAFETGAIEPPLAKQKTSLIVDSATPKSNLSRNSSQRSESELEEDDSGVTDMNKPLSETDTESESFPELRKMTRYQRASTHSRLFKLLQDEGDVIEEEQSAEDKVIEAEFNFKPRKKIVHNVSITRKQNPKALQEAETMTQRRERLSLPLRKNSSIDADNLSSPNSPASPIFGQTSQAVSDQLVNELVQSLLLKKSSSTLKNLPMEKLQAAAKRVLEEELDSLENTSLDSTPALTPQEFKSESYSDYYDSWSAKTDSDNSANGSFEILPSKAFKALQETAATAKRRPWAVRCPRVLSSKTVNRDLARVTESPEIYRRSSNSPETFFGSERASSVGRWRKV